MVEHRYERRAIPGMWTEKYRSRASAASYPSQQEIGLSEMEPTVSSFQLRWLRLRKDAVVILLSPCCYASDNISVE